MASFNNTREVSCEDCKFWQPGSSSIAVNVGECRRWPPRQTVPPWPSTYAAGWCGEYQFRGDTLPEEPAMDLSSPCSLH